jgi:type III secretory pathway component EscV
MRCKYCNGHDQLRNATKCKRHITICPNAPDDVKNQFIIEINEKQRKKTKLNKLKTKVTVAESSDESIISISQSKTSEDSDVQFSELKKASQSSLNSISLSIFDKEKSIELLACAIFSANIPFKFIENKYLIEFFEKIGFKNFLPQRRELSDTILNKVHSKYFLEIQNRINNHNNWTIDISVNIYITKTKKNCN